MATIQDFRDETAGIHVRNPEIEVQVADDTEAPGERTLQVIYPASTGDPAGRDVWFDAIDLSNVARIGFTPQTPEAGELMIGPLRIVE